MRKTLLITGFLSLPGLLTAFPMWLSNAHRENPNDPRNGSRPVPTTSLSSFQTWTFSATGTPVSDESPPITTATPSPTQTQFVPTPASTDTSTPTQTWTPQPPLPTTLPTQTFTALPSPTHVPGSSWTEVTNWAPFTGRWGLACTVFDSKLWMMGGTNFGEISAEVWNTADGTHWNKTHSQTDATAPYLQRSGHGLLTFGGRMWIIAGNRFCDLYLNDVQTSLDGVAWYPATWNAPFSPRGYHSSVVFGGKMWVIGGGDSTQAFGDVWNSADGAHWTRATAAAGFTPRTGHSSVVFNGKIWVIGGENQNGLVKNGDVWNSSDGVHWVLVNPAAAFGTRAGHTSVVFDNKMWVIGGYGQPYPAGKDVWSSSDGVTWTLATLSAFNDAYRTQHASAVFDGSMWAIGGDGTWESPQRDIWRSN